MVIVVAFHSKVSADWVLVMYLHPVSLCYPFVLFSCAVFEQKDFGCEIVKSSGHPMLLFHPPECIWAEHPHHPSFFLSQVTVATPHITDFHDSGLEWHSSKNFHPLNPIGVSVTSAEIKALHHHFGQSNILAPPPYRQQMKLVRSWSLPDCSVYRSRCRSYPWNNFYGGANSENVSIANPLWNVDSFDYMEFLQVYSAPMKERQVFVSACMIIIQYYLCLSRMYYSILKHMHVDICIYVYAKYVYYIPKSYFRRFFATIWPMLPSPVFARVTRQHSCCCWELRLILWLKGHEPQISIEESGSCIKIDCWNSATAGSIDDTSVKMCKWINWCKLLDSKRVILNWASLGERGRKNSYSRLQWRSPAKVHQFVSFCENDQWWPRPQNYELDPNLTGYPYYPWHKSLLIVTIINNQCPSPTIIDQYEPNIQHSSVEINPPFVELCNQVQEQAQEYWLHKHPGAATTLNSGGLKYYNGL